MWDWIKLAIADTSHIQLSLGNWMQFGFIIRKHSYLYKHDFLIQQNIRLKLHNISKFCLKNNKASYKSSQKYFAYIPIEIYAYHVSIFDMVIDLFPYVKIMCVQ